MLSAWNSQEESDGIIISQMIEFDRILLNLIVILEEKGISINPNRAGVYLCKNRSHLCGLRIMMMEECWKLQSNFPNTPPKHKKRARFFYFALHSHQRFFKVFVMKS